METVHPSARKVFVTGDLNLDCIWRAVSFGGISRVPPPILQVGGSAYNAAAAFNRAGFQAILFGSVGTDQNGDLILDSTAKQGVATFVTRHASKPTGTCNLVYFEGDKHLRSVFYPHPNANIYDIGALRKALHFATLRADDLIFSPFHLFEQLDHSHYKCQEFLQTLTDAGSRVIIDLVPHTLYESLTADELNDMIGGPIYMFIGEYHTFLGLLGRRPSSGMLSPTYTDCELVANAFRADYFVCRYGIGNISQQLLFRSAKGRLLDVGRPTSTGYEEVSASDRCGFGDRLTAETLHTLLESSPAPPIERSSQ